jgi:hypothetical protein
MTKNLILDKLFRSNLIDDILWNITGGHYLKEDLKSELFLILMEMSDQKIIAAHKNNWINYLCINILLKQWKSKKSAFYKKYKKYEGVELKWDIMDENDIFDYELLDKVLDIVENKLPFVEKELFMMRYKIGKYDKWLGELRDKDCQKPVYSYRKIEKKLAIDTVNSKKPITIDHSTVEKYHRRSIERIKKILGNNDTK